MNHINEHSFKRTCSKCHHQHVHRLSLHWSVTALIMSELKVTPSLHQALLQDVAITNHCCISPQINRFKAHNDSGPLWWSYDTFDAISLVISHCNITFSVNWLSLGSVATIIMWGGWSSYRHITRWFLNITVKTALKSVNFSRSYRQKYVGSFLWLTVYISIYISTTCIWLLTSDVHWNVSRKKNSVSN